MLLRLKSKTNPPGGIRTSNNVITIIYVFLVYWLSVNYNRCVRNSSNTIFHRNIKK